MKKARSQPCLNSLILLVEQRGIEPLTSALRTRRSAKLSYCPTRREEYSFKFRVSSFSFQSVSIRRSGRFGKPGRGFARIIAVRRSFWFHPLMFGDFDCF